MTRQELKDLKDGTIVYNGHVEGEIRTVNGGEKVIEVWYSIDSMSDDANDRNARPDDWTVLEV